MKELKAYVEGIKADLLRLYEADYSEEEREELEANGEAFDLYSYFDDVLDIEYTISGNGDFLGCRLAVTLGGPNVYVNTREGEVQGYWGSDRAFAWLPSEICAEIDSYFEELYNCTR